jgi:pilus assembly protein Flp/PilA
VLAAMLLDAFSLGDRGWFLTVGRIGSMTEFVASAKKFIKNEDAPTMLEYGLMVALIALVVAIAAQTLGQNLSTLFNTASTSV